MKKMYAVLAEINELTNTLSSDYPELYRLLDENPLTLPNTPKPNIGELSLREYLESLRQLLKHYVETHGNMNIAL